ncbi:MAG: twin-arginine translocase subunit TatC [Collinsella sp.]|nr:twin-arginine translocase subunit TatC [Collinsella sp.]
MPIGPARMPLFDHIGELRRRLTIVVVSVLVASFIMYFATPPIIDILQDPIREYVKEFYVTTALGGFTIRFSIAFKLAIVMCCPLIIWQVFAFFLPALKPNERRWVVPTILAATALFFLGAIFCYFVILNPAFGFLVGEAQAIGTPWADLVDYINTEILLMIGFGIAFELPLIVFYLATFHIVPYSKFREAWRYIYVILLVVAGVVTPDASPVTMAYMYAAMLALYELSLFVTRIVILKRDGKEGLKEGRLSLFDDEDDAE